MAKPVEIVLRVVGTGAIGIGALAAYGAIRLRLKTAQAHKWPTVTGTIVASDVESTKARGPDDKPIRTSSAAIRYTYTVGGKTTRAIRSSSAARAKRAGLDRSSGWSRVIPRESG